MTSQTQAIAPTRPARSLHALDALAELPPLSLDCGVTLNRPQLAYRLEGPQDAPLLLVMGGISANRHVSSWWQGVVGPRQAVDTRDRFRVLGIDWLGGADQSTTGAPDALPISVTDQARAIHALLASLRIERLDAIVGASFGGLVAQALLELAPQIADRAVIIAAADKPDAYASGLRHVQRQILALADNPQGVALARSLAMLSYRSPAEFSERFASPEQVAEYLDYCGEKMTKRFDSSTYLRLSEAIDLHRGNPGSIKIPITLVAFDTDLLAPPARVEAMCQAIGANSRLHLISSTYGHDGFLKEAVAVSTVLRESLKDCCHAS